MASGECVVSKGHPISVQVSGAAQAAHVLGSAVAGRPPAAKQRLGAASAQHRTAYKPPAPSMRAQCGNIEISAQPSAARPGATIISPSAQSPPRVPVQTSFPSNPHPAMLQKFGKRDAT